MSVMRVGMLPLLAATVGVCLGASKLPLSFEANQGQTDPSVRFQSRAEGRTLFLTSTEAVLRTRTEVFRMKLVGANPASKAQGAEPQMAKSNYFIGNDSAKWRTGVANFGRVRFSEVYPAIDLVYYGKDGQLEYDWIVKAGADPSKIRLKFAGATKMHVDPSGDLVLDTPNGEVREKKPVVYLETDHSKEIAGRYVIRGAREVGFEVSAYDRRKNLVIDPVLVYSTFLGGSQTDNGLSIAVDKAGNTYVTGSTTSNNFPTVHPIQGKRASTDESQDVFVTKINAAGNALVYSTYLGGSMGDVGYSIAVDGSGNAYVTGYTQSSDFPTANPIQSTYAGGDQSAFVTKINAAGSALVYSTFLGGRFGAYGYAVAVDGAGDAYVTGTAGGGDFPVMNAMQTLPGIGSNNAFVSKINPAGSGFIYSTFLSGNGGSLGTAIAADSAGNTYVTGSAGSGFPTFNPMQATFVGGSDAFVSKINPSGSAFVFSTFIGPKGNFQANGIALDSADNIYLTGFVSTNNLPTVNPIQGSLKGDDQNAFVTKLNAAGTALVYSTYLGGSKSDQGNGIAVDSAGNAYVTGWTTSADFPTAAPLQATNVSDNETAFVTKINAAGSALVYSTYLGGSSPAFGMGIAVDGSGNAHVTGYSGGGSTQFPTANPIQANIAGDVNAIVLEISSGPQTPSITNVLNGASNQPGIVAGSWATVYGSSLSTVTDSWDKYIVNGKYPTTFDGVTVTVGGQPAYLSYITPTQINFIVPDVGTGTEQVVVKNSAGTSADFSATVNSTGPAFFLWPDNQAVATLLNYTFVAESGTFSGATTAPAKPGDVVILWGTGFGPTDPADPVGEETPSKGTYSTVTLPTVTLNNVPVMVYGAALAPGDGGLYQIAIQVPSSIGSGEFPIQATIGGVTSPTGVVLAVQQ